ncbi:MAG: CCA tRNA nucleotidyltransferase, partial [Proteobacteria bacterium]|nr:CCA tRNA nucleotidyltransferase [Pseudomonadota bacterium]NDD04156.1 CCA tRNA nucleotidyltransferase [Pseudomonadota bacterium]
MNKEELGRKIISVLQNAGHEAYFAGGCVRDRERGVTPKDYDIATSALPEEVMHLFPKTVPVGLAFGVVLVIEEGIHFEIATFRTERNYRDGRHPSEVTFSNLENDSKRRDFTVNGLYWDIKTNQIVDNVGGRDDIQKKIIRTIGLPDQRFKEDHLRMMRAIRFSVQLGFEIEPQT